MSRFAAARRNCAAIKGDPSFHGRVGQGPGRFWLPGLQRPRLGGAVAALGFAAVLLAPPMVVGGPAYPTRTQTISLKEGWNAVFLEVEAADPSPSAIFAGTPVDVAAQLLRMVRISRFATDPNEVLANDDSWGVWYGPEREESAFSNLYALRSHHALLVHSQKDFTWNVTGKPFLKRIYWKPDSFNLVGFPVSSTSTPTFAEFFRGVPAHEGQPVFRMSDGKWRKVERPAETLMRRGEAYWVFCRGGSDYQGPMDVRLSHGDHLRFAESHTGILIVENRSPNPGEVTLTQASGAGGLPLDFLFKGLMETHKENFAARLPQTYTMPAIDAGVRGSIVLRLHDPSAIGSGATNLFRVSSDSGVEYWVAAFAEAATTP